MSDRRRGRGGLEGARKAGGREGRGPAALRGLALPWQPGRAGPGLWRRRSRGLAAGPSPGGTRPSFRRRRGLGAEAAGGPGRGPGALPGRDPAAPLRCGPGPASPEPPSGGGSPPAAALALPAFGPPAPPPLGAAPSLAAPGPARLLSRRCLLAPHEPRGRNANLEPAVLPAIGLTCSGLLLPSLQLSIINNACA